MQTKLQNGQQKLGKDNTLYPYLEQSSKIFLDSISERYSLTFQEVRKLAEAARDLQMWGESSISDFWSSSEKETRSFREKSQQKKALLKTFFDKFEELRNSPKKYAKSNVQSFKSAEDKLRPVSEDSDKKIYGECPVAAPETVCCNLRTIDAVENCVFGCSYCTIQTFYGEEAVFDSKFKEKLAAIEIDPNRFYHFGTGQSSDSLVWGNKENILSDLCEFARKHPNILLEFKTKSANIAYFLNHDIPSNVVLSWSLNTPTVIENEEHFTVGLKERIGAARKVADLGIPVAFHFHPMVYYEGWEEDYSELAATVQKTFRSEEVLFISYGSVTFIKPVMKQIRKRGGKSRILQMNLVPAPKGKFSYPEELKVKQFNRMHQGLSPWNKNVFTYLCMEPAPIWDQVFGWHYSSNELFEVEFGRKTLDTLPRLSVGKEP